ncbi:hypothetical protein DFR58_10895 [Anaerobacterium chartisolvens]|uniref:Uncharacterized protein n=1 Tax=Anaerobacterium chartisolvens TaxID=1297424 RepID=A0A369B704_9FIRM|nr:hypothetical protein [Anaerobacterium chartisolvens]RCX17201.1 hypothetical protein DFR58_10895 [Anaerobacterium chartisolvens]
MGDIIAFAVVILLFCISILKILKEYLLKREQIKADALVKCEELRLKNQIELEKLIKKDYKSEQ